MADFGTFIAFKLVNFSTFASTKNLSESVQLGYMQWIPQDNWPPMVQKDRTSLPNPNPIGIMICMLLSRLAWEDESLRRLAVYYRTVSITGVGGALMQEWPIEALSDDVAEALKHKLETSSDWDDWDEWSGLYHL